MTPEEHARIATDLLRAEETGRQIELLSLRHSDMAMDDAYAVQNAICRRKLAQGRKVIGWKIGLTSKAMQYALDINIPDSGILFDDMAFDHGATVPAGRFIQPRIEAEIAFVMKNALGGDDVSPVDVRAATEYVAPSSARGAARGGGHVGPGRNRRGGVRGRPAVADECRTAGLSGIRAVHGHPRDPDLVGLRAGAGLACAARARVGHHTRRGVRRRRAREAGLTMEPIAIGLLGLGALVALIAIRVPIAYAMIVVGAVGIAILSGPRSS